MYAFNHYGRGTVNCFKRLESVVVVGLVATLYTAHRRQSELTGDQVGDAAQVPGSV